MYKFVSLQLQLEVTVQQGMSLDLFYLTVKAPPDSYVALSAIPEDVFNKNFGHGSDLTEAEVTQKNHMSRLMGKPTICIYENKGADQLRGDREAAAPLFSLHG